MNETLINILSPKPASDYKHITRGGEHTITLNQDEECVILKIHDYGVKTLSASEIGILHGLVAKLKSEIWP